MAHTPILFSFLVLLTNFPLPTTSGPLSPRAYGGSACKPLHSDPGWPNSAAWAKLNASVSGHLFVPTPLAAACYGGAAPGATPPTADCGTVVAQWNASSFRAQDPTSMESPNWEQDACIPQQLLATGATPKCDATAFPRYVVAASDAKDVAAAVKFAALTGVRLVVRSTGHDYLGRSNAPDSLSIWTQKMKELTLHDSFAPKACGKVKAGPGITMGAGWRWGEVYDYVWARNLSVVGGSDKDVGIVGWLTGGGHSPVSPKYGLGVDNVLEMEIVTPKGDIVTANECVNPDLFWAFRGGGGSTFGVMTSLTMTTYPDEPAALVSMRISSTPDEAAKNNNTNFYTAAAYFTAQLPDLNRASLAGYYQIAPSNFLGWGNGPTGSNNDSTATCVAYFYALSTSTDDVNKAVAPLKAAMAEVDPAQLITNMSVSSAPSFAQYHNGFAPLNTGLNLLLPSRLWDAAALKSPLQPSITRTVVEQSAGGLQGIFVAGPAVRQGDPDSSAANPAWRVAYAHVSTSANWPLGAGQDAVDRGRRLAQEVLQPALTSAAPGTGVYLNENTPYNPDWRQDFWGAHYPRLKAIKEKWDPEGVFWCMACVGSEAWSLDGSGKLCRA